MCIFTHINFVEGVVVALIALAVSTNVDQENLGKLQFWGKIQGETNDYLIAHALVPGYGFPTKKFFYW